MCYPRALIQLFPRIMQALRGRQQLPRWTRDSATLVAAGGPRYLDALRERKSMGCVAFLSDAANGQWNPPSSTGHRAGSQLLHLPARGDHNRENVNVGTTEHHPVGTVLKPSRHCTAGGSQQERAWTGSSNASWYCTSAGMG